MRFVYQTLGFLLIAVGLPLFWTPLPFGLVLIAIGTALVRRPAIPVQRRAHAQDDQVLGRDHERPLLLEAAHDHRI